jgi:putative addiction module component (TIGR02574 family)
VNAAVERIEAEILQLSTEERAYLAQRLIESLDDEEMDDPAEVERAWELEIERRVADYRSGKLETIPAEEVRRKIRALLE